MRKNNQKAKQKFRASKKWRDFREKIRNEQLTDPVTGANLTKMANLHHMDMNEEHYEDISDESHFVFLNQLTHKCLHFLAHKDWKKRLEGLTLLLERMAEINGWK